MKCDREIEKALSRYAAIAPVAKEGMSRAEACEGWTEVREARARNVDGADVSMRTLRRWATAYHDEGFEGLQRKERGDKGQLRAMNAAVLDRAIALKEELPSRSVRQIIDIMTAEGTIEPGEIARSTLSRHLKEAGCMDLPKKSPKATRRFVKERPNQLWQGDLKYGPYIPDSTGKPRRTYLIAFIDDCSRLIPHAQFYLDQKGPSLEDCLKKAIIKRGVPEAIFVDNGKIFVSRQLRVACATLGVRHLTAAPYSPEAKGKIEKWLGFVQSSFINELKVSPAMCLEELNERFGAWVEEFYHNRPHSSLDGKSPLEVYRSSIKNIRTETYEAITEAFKHSAERKVDHTGCFSFEGQTFRCGVDHAGKRVLLRYDPSDLSSVEVFYKNERIGIATPIKVCVQGGNDKQTSGPDSVSFDKLMVERQQQSLERRLGAISFSGLEEDKDV